MVKLTIVQPFLFSVHKRWIKLFKTKTLIKIKSSVSGSWYLVGSFSDLDRLDTVYRLVPTFAATIQGSDFLGGISIRCSLSVHLWCSGAVSTACNLCSPSSNGNAKYWNTLRISTDTDAVSLSMYRPIFARYYSIYFLLKVYTWYSENGTTLSWRVNGMCFSHVLKHVMCFKVCLKCILM